MAFKLNNKLKKWDPYVAFHGNTLKSFYRPRTKESPNSITKKGFRNNYKIECWILILVLILSFYLDKDMVAQGNQYFVSTKAIHKTLCAYGNEYSLRHVRRSIKQLEDDGFIKREAYEATDIELKLNPKNKHLRRRKIIPNMELILKYLNVYDESDKLLKELPDKARAKKLIYKRPFSYTKYITEKYNEYKKNYNGMKRSMPFKNENEMFAYWVIKHSSKFYSVNALIDNFIPASLDNRQEVADNASIGKASNKGVLDLSMVDYYCDNIDFMDREEREFIIGYKIPEKFVGRMSLIGYQCKKGYIESYHRVYRTYGFDNLL